MTSVGGLSLRRYDVRRVLGRGGTGVVYEAFDTKNQAIVALKTIVATAAENLYRLKQEFRALSDVQHRNLMRFGELACEDGQWFFTMELVRGKSFIEHVRPRARAPDMPSQTTTDLDRPILRLLGEAPPTGPTRTGEEVNVEVGPALDEARLRAALKQLVDVLCAIPDAGHVQRDVKPSNVLVGEDGRVVLLDFGLVTALMGRGAETGEIPAREMLGTPAYMAPEQAEGLAVGPAADWYAVGVMLYLALTGVLPFSGTGLQMIRAKVSREAPSPRAIAPDAPADLAALCTELLRIEPADRPAASVIRARVGLEPNEGSGTFQAAAPVFVGRGDEMAVLARAFDDVQGGKGRIVIVEGEPGVGKSALVHHFLDTVASAPVVLSGRCYEQESVPFKGVDSIVDALSEYLLTCSEDDATTLLEGGSRYLATVFPVLTRVPAVAGAVSRERGVDNESGLRDQAFSELERLVDALARRSPLVLYLDDVQWADTDSLALLQRVLLRPRGAACLFVGTIRSGMDQGSQLAELLAAGERVVVRGLGENDARALWDALWPAAAGSASSADRDLAMREAAGHPLFLAELARAARSGHLEHSGRLQDVLWQRIQEREPFEQRFLEMLALAGAPTPYEIIARAGDVDVGECLTRLGSLKAAQLVRVTRRGDDRLVEAYHDRIREAIADHLGADGSRVVGSRHLRLARALRESTPDDALPSRVFAILKHLEASGEPITGPKERRDTAALHLIASRTARLTTAYDRARQHARDGLALVGDGGWDDAYELTRDLHVQSMEAEHLAGQTTDARACFDRARSRLRSLDDKVALYTSWIALETAHGRFVEAIAAGREILGALGAPLPANVSMAHVLGQYAADRIAQGRRSVDELVSLPTLEDKTRESTMRILMALAPPAFFSDTTLLTWIMLRIAGLSMTHGACNVSAYGFAGYGMVLAGAFGKQAEGAAFGRLALALNDRFGNASLAGKLHFIDGAFIRAWTRPIADAKEALARAYDEALRHGDTAYEAYTVTNTSIMEFCEAVPPAALQKTAEWAHEISARRREPDMAGSNAALARYAATVRGLTPDPRDLGIEGSSDAELAASLGDKTILARFLYTFCRAELAYFFGDYERAHAFLVEASQCARSVFGMLMMIELACLEALVAAKRYDAAPLGARPALVWTVASRVRKVRALSRGAPALLATYERMARGELLRIGGARAKADEAFGQAVESARARGIAKHEGLALDLAAANARGRGEIARADLWRAEATDAFRRWGSPVLADRRS
jgi:predicted ATPase